MKPYEIKLQDIQRILLGEVPLHFYIELIFRFLLLYALLIVAMRLMGKRMSSKLSRNEMAAIASLAAAVGVPLMNPDRGLLPAIIVAAVILCFQTFIAKKAAQSRKFEKITQDELDVLVRDGVLDPQIMKRTRITQARIFAQLRSEGLRHLGMVKRLYFEAGGGFSLLKAPEPKPGLSILPPWDKEVVNELRLVPGSFVCEDCGTIKPNGVVYACPNCTGRRWTLAVEYQPK